jgi:Fic-DOC domain mobile mystery protein B
MGLKFTYEHGQTQIQPDEQDGLLIKSISTLEELNEWEHRNVQDAVEWTLKKKFHSTDILSEEFCCELHRKMYGDVWRWAGEFRKSEKTIGIENWTQIPIELRQLLDDCKHWIQHQIFEADEIAVRFKHRIVFIHCFTNGNGRHSRLMADLIVNQILGLPFFSWGGGVNLIKKGDSREEYIKALKAADKGDVSPLLAFARS